MKKILSTLCLGILCIGLQASTPPTIKESPVVKKTYPFSDPNPVANPTASIYPYFRWDGFTKIGEDKQWKVVELENEYVKVTIYPEIGGKVWGATEKKSGHKFLYDNGVVKFREIAMRGPWTSGGVEFNFGVIGHAPSTATPVDYALRTNDDGSVSCFVGTLDLLTRTWWNVEVRLDPDKAFFTTNTYWYNPRSVQTPFYNWMNAGYPVSEELEFCFPGTYSVGHGGNIDSWPVDSMGRKISWYKNNNFEGSKSHHISGSLADYYGAYYHDTDLDFGSVHHSAVGEKLGKKVFLWALSREGEMWKDLLSDVDGQYVELQSGRLYNQEVKESQYTPFKHNGFVPSGAQQFLEYWYPTLSTKGIVATNEWGTLNYKKANGKVEVFFSPLQAIDDTLSVMCGGKRIFAERISVKPLELWTRSIPCAEGDITIEVGAGKLAYNPIKGELTRPSTSPSEFDWNSVYGLYTNGRQLTLARDYNGAEASLTKALAIDPYFAPALEQMSEIKFLRGQYLQSKDYASKALSVDTYLPTANLLFGAASLELGAVADAIDGYTLAGLSANHRMAGTVGAAKSYAAAKRWNEVIFFATKALECGFNPEAYQLLSIAYRNLGQKDKALAALKEIEKVMPLNHFVTVERMLLGEVSPQQLTQQVRCELPNEVFIEMGIWYETIGAKNDALALYAAVPFHPLIAYRQAYLSGDASYIALAENAPADFVLPSRGETLKVMDAAAAVSDNWKTLYYQALLQLSLGVNVDGAKQTLVALGEKPDFAPFYLSRAAIVGENILADLKRAESLSGNNWRAGVALIQEYKRLGQYADMLKTADQYNKLYPKNEQIQMGRINALTANNRLEQAVKVMREINILPFEGSTIGRTMFREANLQLAINAMKAKKYSLALKYIDESEQWGENLGVGRPFDDLIDSRSENYLRAMIYQKMGNKASAEKMMESVVGDVSEMNPNTVLSAYALRTLGRTADADALMSKFVQQSTNANVAKWAKALYDGDVALAREIAATSDIFVRSSAPGGPVVMNAGYLPIVIKIMEIQ